MKYKIVLMILLLAGFLYGADVKFNAFTNETTVGTGDEFAFWDSSAVDVKNIKQDKLRDWIFASAFSLGGKLTGAANEIEGSNFDINGGNIDGTAIGSGTPSTGAFTTIAASGAVTLSDALTVGAGDFTYAATAITSTGAEINILDGCTSTFTELNILDGCTSTTAELNILDGVTSDAGELNLLDAGSTESIFDSGTAVTIRANGVNQVRQTDGTWEPITDNDINLGSVTKQFKNLYLHGFAYTDGIDNDGETLLDAGKFTFNDASGDYDATFETDNRATAFELDAGKDYIRIGCAFGLNSIQQFANGDTTPDVTGYSNWATGSTAVTITDFDGSGIYAGQILVVQSKGVTTWDVTGSGIIGGTTDIITASGCMTTFIYEDSDWHIIAYIDITDDLN